MPVFPPVLLDVADKLVVAFLVGETLNFIQREHINCSGIPDAIICAKVNIKIG